MYNRLSQAILATLGVFTGGVALSVSTSGTASDIGFFIYAASLVLLVTLAVAWLIVRQRTTLPMVLDECIRDVQSLLRAYEAKALEAFNLKISKVGGLTKAKLMRDLAVELGLRVTIEDAWGGDLVTAAVSHVAASTPPDTLFTVSFMNDWTNEHIAGHQPRSQAGFGSAPTAPGLGIDVDVEALGAPLFFAS